MLKNKEILSAVNFYAVLKKDINTLLVKESIYPIDYIGKIEMNPHFTELTYPIKENPENYQMVLDISMLIESMLKDDIRLWEKSHIIKRIQVEPNRRCENVTMTIGFMK